MDMESKKRIDIKKLRKVIKRINLVKSTPVWLGFLVIVIIIGLIEVL